MKPFATILALLFVLSAPSFAQTTPVHHAKPHHKAAAKVAPDTSPIVWVNLPTGIYHFKGERWYGRTKSGTYMSENAAIKAGYRATENGQ